MGTIDSVAVEKKADRKDRLQSAGVWPEFVSYRQNLRNEGISNKDSEKMAHEKYLGHGQESSVAVLFDEDDEATPVEPPAAPLQPAIQVKHGSVTNHYISAALFENKPDPSAIKVVNWIFDNIAIEDPDPLTAPSAGAWGYLWECRTSAVVRSEFYKSTYSKLLPSRTQLETKDKFDDDGHKVIENIDKVMAFSLEADGLEPEDTLLSEGIPGLPAADNQEPKNRGGFIE